MTVEMRPVSSRKISAIGWDPETQELHVTFNGGKTAVYSHADGISEDTFKALLSAPSVGKAFNELVLDVYGHRYL